MERQTLFRTVHGSHLYGLAHAGSDHDTYEVVTRLPYVAHNGSRSKYARQTIQGSEDRFVIDLSTFMAQCDRGVPQALEAMFSTVADVDHIAELRAGYRAGGEVVARYLRTIKAFYNHGDAKRRRHAARLAQNLQDIRQYGRFNPKVYSVEALDLLTRLSHEDLQDFALRPLQSLSEMRNALRS